jgi:zona occludens toxin
LGRPQNYNITFFTGVSLGKKDCMISNFVRTYDKEIFPLYKSYEGPGGKELVVDGRGNMLTWKKMIWLLLLVVMAAFVFYKYVYGYFDKMRTPAGASSSGSHLSVPGQSVQSSDAFGIRHTNTAGTANSSSEKKDQVFALGFVQVLGGSYLVVQVENGVIYENKRLFPEHIVLDQPSYAGKPLPWSISSRGK